MTKDLNKPNTVTDLMFRGFNLGVGILLIILVLVSGCEETNNQTKKNTESSQIANPASVYCKEQGGKLEIRTNTDGSQTGYCIFDDFECEEWKFYRGECKR